MIVSIDTAGWARWPEVVAYSERNQVTLGAAIVNLANAGLSSYPSQEEK